MYEITSIEDVSRHQCKRYVVHINVAPDINKSDVKTAIIEATEEIKNKYNIVHVVRLYIHIGKKIICQSMWMDKNDDNIRLPLPLKYNDNINDIGIVWC